MHQRIEVLPLRHNIFGDGSIDRTRSRPLDFGEMLLKDVGVKTLAFERIKVPLMCRAPRSRPPTLASFPVSDVEKVFFSACGRESR